ncbi:MAG: tetratricopeptide repeat protein [Clostridia bacterium]|nr:tetratricopeptide repeat protein [Clostridia bacterium]
MKKIALLLAIVMVLTMLVGCKKSDYEQAIALYDQGEYEQAAALFEQLGDYEDSKTRALDSMYLHAESLFEAGSYVEAIDVYSALGDYEDAQDKIAEAEKQIMYQTYADVYGALLGDTWFYADPDSNAVNMIYFTKDNAYSRHITYDVEGANVGDKEIWDFYVEDAFIIFSMKDSTDGFELPYHFEGDQLIVGDGDFVLIPAAQVEEDLQGYWGVTYQAIGMTFGQLLTVERIYCFDNGKLSYEYANENVGNFPPTYTGPFEGTYSINENGLEAKEDELGFIIKDNHAVAIYGGQTCVPYEGFKGPDGYSF